MYCCQSGTKLIENSLQEYIKSQYIIEVSKFSSKLVFLLNTE